MTRAPHLLVGLLLGAVVLGLVLGPGRPAASQERPAPAAKVLVFSVPTLTWQSVLDERPPALTGLLARSAVASLSVRTIGPRTSLGEGYATIGAGNRAGTATGAALAVPVPGTGIVVTGAEALARVNGRMDFGARPGALGQALAGAGLAAGVVANADVALPGGGVEVHREAAAAVMDRRGVVPVGTVGPELSVVDPPAPGGRSGDTDAMVAAFEQVWKGSDLVLVEAPDLARLQVATGPGAGGADRAERRRALGQADDLLAALLGRVDLDRHLVMVVAPASNRPGRDSLTVAALAGPGVAPGVATSASTNRAGYVVLPDVAPTALAALGVEAPASMNGVVLASAGGGSPGPSRFAELAEANDIATFRDEATGPFSVAFVVLQICVYAVAAAALSRWTRLRPAVSSLALVVLALPPVAFLSGLVPSHRLSVGGFIVASFLAAAALALGAQAAVHRWLPPGGRTRPLAAPLVLVGLTVAVLVGDVLAGSALQLNTVFGYSPIVAGRFSGYGNLAFAQVSMGALVLVTGAWAALGLGDDSVPQQRRRRGVAGVAAVLAVVVVADGHPAFGADVGGVLALVPAAVIVVVLLLRQHLRPRHAVVGLAVTALVVTAFAAADLARPAGERTHVGRFAARVLDGGAGVGTILERKLGANVSLLFSSVWSLIIPAALAFFAFLLWYRPRLLGQVDAAVPGLRALLVGGLVLAVLGGGLNDSGVAVPAMMLAVLLPYLTVLAMALTRPT
ncbi:MAG TPA: hypothetical protein VNT56_08510 [Acidimicrobiales bacterium]|nr:hypothetical protein [Acidimicrobiales bacterium]